MRSSAPPPLRDRTGWWTAARLYALLDRGPPPSTLCRCGCSGRARRREAAAASCRVASPEESADGHGRHGALFFASTSGVRGGEGQQLRTPYDHGPAQAAISGHVTPSPATSRRRGIEFNGDDCLKVEAGVQL
ncbi:hypothetical protein VPH35_095075 [Triticum aestivum]